MVSKWLDLLRSKRVRARDHYQRGNRFNELRRWQDAVAEYDQAIALNAGYADAYCNRGVALQSLGRREAALASYQRAAALNPQDSLTFYNQGALLREMQRLDAALASYERCIALQPAYVEAHINLGNVLQEMKRHEEAVASYDRSIALRPVYAEAFQNRAFSLVQLRQFEHAVASYDHAVEIDPKLAEAFQGRLYALVSLGRFDAAIETYDHLLALDPNQPYLAGMRVHAKMQICDWSGLREQLSALATSLRAFKLISPPFPLLSAVDSPTLQRIAAELWVRAQCPPDPAIGPIAPRSRREKIRIAYFSADFRSHAVSQLTVELFETHDRSRFEIVAFAFGPRTVDPLQARLKQAFDQFIDVSELSDLDVALLSRSMAVDIAVDLGGFTEACRTKVFALRAAPVQINYLGYPGTMGAPYIDYLIADRTVVPLDAWGNFSEKILYMPNSYLPHDSTNEIAACEPSRKQLNLPTQGFVFCCFNKKYKLTPQIFDSWMRILGRIDGSVLWLANDNEIAARNLRVRAASHGIEANRLIFSGRIESLSQHLARHRAADLFLDTVPYNAHATAADALWAGLPVLTLMGNSFASRVAASLLKSIGLPELITRTIDEYEEVAIDLGQNPQRLVDLKQRLTVNRTTRALFDSRRFIADLELGFTMVHARSLDGLPPDHIFVNDSAVGGSD